MTHSTSRSMRLFQESFVPVVLIVLSIFLMLLYVQFRAEYDADKVTVINIRGGAVSISDSEAVAIAGDSEPMVSSGLDADQQRASELMAQGK